MCARVQEWQQLENQFDQVTPCAHASDFIEARVEEDADVDMVASSKPKKGKNKKKPQPQAGAATDDDDDDESNQKSSANQPPEPPQPQRSADDILKSIDGLIGLSQFKSQVRTFVARVEDKELLRKKGGNVSSEREHMLLLGPPGVGKTMCAGLLAELLRAIGFITKGHLIEKKGVDLLAQHVGNTPDHVHKITASAAGRVLFIDELYGVGLGVSNQGANFNKEAADTLLSDLDKPDWICVGAGYEKEMGKFLKLNPGLARRFPYKLVLEPYSIDDLACIFKAKMTAQSIALVPEHAVLQKIKDVLRERQDARRDDWGNAGEVDTLIARIRDKRLERLGFVDRAIKDAMSLAEYLATHLEDIPSVW